MITNLICGFIGIGLLVVFLGFYALRLGSVALWAIVVSILLMVAFDFIQSVRDKGDNTRPDG